MCNNFNVDLLFYRSFCKKWPFWKIARGSKRVGPRWIKLFITRIGHTQFHTKNGYFTLVNALLYIHSGFFSHSMKLRSLPLSAVTVSLHYICQDICVQQQAATCGKTPTILTWSEPWYCYAIKTNSRRICSQVRPRRGPDISELQAPSCMTPVPWNWLLCSVSVLLANELSLQE